MEWLRGHPALDLRIWQWAFHTSESHAKPANCLLLKNRRTTLLSNTLTKQFMNTVNCVITPEIIMNQLHTLSGPYPWEVKEMKTAEVRSSYRRLVSTQTVVLRCLGFPWWWRYTSRFHFKSRWTTNSSRSARGSIFECAHKHPQPPSLRSTHKP